MSVPISQFISSSLPCLGDHMFIDCLHLFFFNLQTCFSTFSLTSEKRYFTFSVTQDKQLRVSIFFTLSNQLRVRFIFLLSLIFNRLLLMILWNISWGWGIFSYSSSLSFIQSTITLCLNYNRLLIYLLPLSSCFYFYQSICNTETRMKL